MDGHLPPVLPAQRMLFVAINKLVNSVSHGSGSDADGASQLEAAAARAAEAGGEVGTIMKRLFKELYSKGEVGKRPGPASGTKKDI